MATARKPAILAFEDGSVFPGLSFGADVDGGGETVFNTSMSGYQEVLTDPSYKGQMVVMTVSHVGNYGISPEDVESSKPHVEGFIVREACAEPSNWRSTMSLPEYLRRNGIPGIEGVDTRAIVQLLRAKGALRAVIATREAAVKALVARAKAIPPIEERDLVAEVSCRAQHEWDETIPTFKRTVGRTDDQLTMDFAGSGQAGGAAYRIVVVDCGVKFNILRSLVAQGCQVTVVPAFTPAGEILRYKPDGVVFSNGPGDPDRLPQLVEAVKRVCAAVPVFGICLGHQVIGKAFGGKTYKLKFGHHGGNQPVKRLSTGKVAITVQNHNFAVDAASLPDKVEVTHLNLNDGTVEGLRHRTLPVFSVQYHPEAAPGSHDAAPHFREFVRMIAAHQAGGKGVAAA